VTIDNKLSLTEIVNNMCKAAHYHVRSLRHFRQYVSQYINKSTATSLVGVRLYYCNAVFYGTSGKISINCNVFRTRVVKKIAVNTIILHYYFPKHVFFTRLHF